MDKSLCWGFLSHSVDLHRSQLTVPRYGSVSKRDSKGIKGVENSKELSYAANWPVWRSLVTSPSATNAFFCELRL